ncbi:MAG: nucleotidyltransferase [Anaerolineae bacterium]|nr:hypothetical protein [Caldilineales bacterium]MDW8267535.1 nucleotidyltransferase [Anaerolineae bacterium]
MPAPTLVVMAAGIGSRYGGLKQIDPVGPHGELIIDYSVYDALQAGFATIIFLIRHDIEEVFRARVGRTIEARAEVRYVFQELSDLPAGYEPPSTRRKPWGTAHAVLCCRHAVSTPFAAINADDFYGREAFAVLAEHLRRAKPQAADYALVGYRLANTLSEHGYVSRAECRISADGYLTDVRERLRVERRGEGIVYSDDGEQWTPIPGDTLVSMNMWGFTPAVFPALETHFIRFLDANADRLDKAEFLLPNVVGDMVRAGEARVRVLPTTAHWFGVTYQEDRPRVQAAIRALTAQGLYPSPLWEAER